MRSCEGAGAGARWGQSSAPRADGGLPGKRGDLGGSPSLAVLQPPACVAQQGGSCRSANTVLTPSQARKRPDQRRMNSKHIFLCFPKIPELPNVLFTDYFRSLCHKVSGLLLSNTGSPRFSITLRRSCLDLVCL